MKLPREATPSAAPRWRARRILLRCAVALFVGFAFVEGSVRYLLLADSCADWRIARRLRQPSRFGRMASDDLPSVLHSLWLPAEQRNRMPPWCPYHDERLGWTSDLFRPGDYAHVDDPRLGGRRPILLFGDSFAAGVVSRETSYQALLERTPWGASHALLNYGVPGYGLDQVHLLLREVLERRANSRPIVVVGLLVDDDLDRCLLSFRNWPKPRLHVQDGRLIDPRQRIPTVEEYFAGDPALPRSFAWAMLRARFVDRSEPGTPAQEAEKQDLSRLLLRAIVADLRRRELPFFFVLFNASAATVDPQTLGWRQTLVRDELTTLRAAWVEVRDEILRAAERQQRPVTDYFRGGDDHLNEQGNRAALDAILRGLTELGS